LIFDERFARGVNCHDVIANVEGGNANATARLAAILIGQNQGGAAFDLRRKALLRKTLPEFLLRLVLTRGQNDVLCFPSQRRIFDSLGHFRGSAERMIHGWRDVGMEERKLHGEGER